MAVESVYLPVFVSMRRRMLCWKLAENVSAKVQFSIVTRKFSPSSGLDDFDANV
jgi:hypothetical protein